jgi:hypothetical protein
MWSCNLLERFLCFCQGHRALTACASYGADLPNGRVRELHYCLACNNPVWVARSADLTKQDHAQAWPEQ